MKPRGLDISTNSSMTRSTLYLLLARPATAQPIKPLTPVVVKLLPSDVIREPLIGWTQLSNRPPRAEASACDRCRACRHASPSGPGQSTVSPHDD
jgi:hypothetical protein